MSKLGMDAKALESLVNQLQSQAGAVNAVVTRVDQLVFQIDVEWDGPRARAFVSDWRGRYRPALLRAHDHVAGLATSARNNISEQRAASQAGAHSAGRVDVRKLYEAISDLSTVSEMRLNMIGILTSSVALKSVPWNKVTVGDAWKMLRQGSRLGDKAVEASKLSKVFKGMSFLGLGVGSFELGYDLAAHASVGTIAGDVVEVGLTAVGIAVPPVGLAYGAWQVGTIIGEGIAEHTPVKGLIDTATDAVVREGGRHVHGDPTTSPRAAAELTKRYSGPMGPINVGRDWFGSVIHNR